MHWRPTRFDKLSPQQQTDCFAKLGESRVPPLRTAHQAFRRLILAVHYSAPAVQRAIGYPGPLHTRDRVVDWEGAATGDATLDSEPIARGNFERRRAKERNGHGAWRTFWIWHTSERRANPN